MKKLVLAVAILAFAASSSFASAGHFAIELENVVGRPSPYDYLMKILSDDYGVPIPTPVASQTINLVYDLTDQLSISGGVSYLSITGSDIMGSSLGYDGEGLSSTGIALGAKYRFYTGNLCPVIGFDLENHAFYAPKDYLYPARLESLFTFAVRARLGMEWTLTPGLLLMFEAVVVESASASMQLNDVYYGFDEQARWFPGGSIGMRWYFF